MRDSIIPGIVIEVYPSSLDSERRPKCYRRRSAAHRRPRRQPFGPDTRRSFAQRQLPHPDERYFLKHLALDQKTIWTSPAHIKPADLKWLAPWSGIATGLFITDPASYHPNTWKEVSNYGLGAALGTTAAMYAWGHLTHSERSRETGVLATEAMLDVLPMQFAIRGATGRLRPYQSNYQNAFFDGARGSKNDLLYVMPAIREVI